MQFSTVAIVSSFLASLALAAPVATCSKKTDANCIPGYTYKSYYANFEAIPNGTYIKNLQGLTWSGFQSTTLHEGIIPADCYYVGPDRSTKCHYAYAAHARDAVRANLPQLAPTSPATLFKLTNFSFALGDKSYYGMDETVRVSGYQYVNGTSGDMKLAKTVDFTYNTAIAGAVGAPVTPVSMPADFGAYPLITFNVTTDGPMVPVLYLDDVSIVTYTPA